MEALFERHQEYLTDTPTYYVRTLMNEIDWGAPLLMIRGPKGVGKSTLIRQYILENCGISDRHALD